MPTIYRSLVTFVAAPTRGNYRDSCGRVDHYSRRPRGERGDRLKMAAAAVIALCVVSPAACAATASPGAVAARTAPTVRTGPTVRTAPTVRICTGAGDLRLRIAGGHRNGTSGSVGYTLDVTNISRSECSLSGYPAVSMISRAGRQLGSPAGRGQMTVVPLVILAPGATAHTTLAYYGANVTAGRRCGPVVTGFELRVYLAGQKLARYARLAVRACSKPGDVYLRITEAFRSGAG